MADLQSEILNELKKQTEFFERIDWKLWMIQNMIESIAKESGYTFDVASNNQEEPVERPETPVSGTEPKYNKDWSID
jgi:hypothetical protein